MRQVMSWLVPLFIVFSLTACASMSGKQMGSNDMASNEPVTVKCPFCEHEFQWQGK